MPSVIAFIPARAGSERVPHKNIRPLAGHPLLAYAIATAQQSRASSSASSAPPTRRRSPTSRAGTARRCRFSARPSSRRRPLRTSSGSTYTLAELPERYDLFALISATNPFRGADVVRRGLEQLLATPEADSIRAVELVKQHPGKMWVLDEEERTMRPLLEQSAARRRLARGPVPGAPARLRPEQRARDRLDARRHGHGHPRRADPRAVPHRGPRGLQRRRRGGLAAGGGARRLGRGRATRDRPGALPVSSDVMSGAR